MTTERELGLVLSLELRYEAAIVWFWSWLKTWLNSLFKSP